RQRPDLAIHRFTAAIARGEAVVMHGDGSSERDYTYITDAVAGTVAALDWLARAPERTCTAFNIGGGARVRLARLLQPHGQRPGIRGRTPPAGAVVLPGGAARQGALAVRPGSRPQPQLRRGPDPPRPGAQRAGARGRGDRVPEPGGERRRGGAPRLPRARRGQAGQPARRARRGV